MNARGFVSLSTQPLNFPAARSCPEAGTLMPANQCGLGQQPDVSGFGEAAKLEHWQLNAEPSSPIDTALKVLPRLWVFLSNCPIWGNTECHHEASLEACAKQAAPPTQHAVPTPSPLQPPGPLMPAANSQGSVTRLENRHKTICYPHPSSPASRSLGSFQDQKLPERPWLSPQPPSKSAVAICCTSTHLSS